MWFWEIESEKCSKWPFEKKLEADSLNLTNEFMLYLGDKSVLRSKHMLLLCFVCDLFKCHIISCLIDFFVYANGWENSHLLFLICLLQNTSSIKKRSSLTICLSIKMTRKKEIEIHIKNIWCFSEWFQIDLSCNLKSTWNVKFPNNPINKSIDTSFSCIKIEDIIRNALFNRLALTSSLQETQ